MAAYRVLYDDVFDTIKNSGIVNTVLDFNDQYDNTENYNLVKYPAVYVEAGEVEWNKNQNNFMADFQIEPQTGTAKIRIHLVYHTLKGFDKATKDSFFNLGNRVVSLIQRLKTVRTDGGTYSTLIRVGEEYITPREQLRVVIYEFETQLTDIFEEVETEEETVSFTIATDYE